MVSSLRRAPQQLFPRERRDHGGQLRPPLTSGEGDAKRLQVSADGLQLTDERARLEARLDELAEPRQRLGGEPANAGEVEMDVVSRQSQLLEVCTHGFGRNPVVAQRSDRGTLGP